ncbi:MAG TPA: hypothetical protein VH477_11840 [Bryobacteraceae bacterium]|jgi:hypothetical protein
MNTIHTRVRRFATKFQCSLFALGIAAVCPLNIFAQNGHAHAPAAQQQEMAAEDQTNANTLLKVIRQATEQYKDVNVAKAAGYALQFGCVSGEDSGAMGLHYVNMDLVNNAVLDPTRPQIVIYEPMPDGTLKLIGADFLILAEGWNKTHSGAPELMGQYFHLFTAPNRFGLPEFYTLHVWAWKPNPWGAFVNWHANVSCSSFAGEKQ